MVMNEFKRLAVWLAGVILSVLPFQHELAHALAATALGLQVTSFNIFGSVRFAGWTPWMWLIGLAGGLANALCLTIVLLATRKHVAFKFQNWTVTALIVIFVVYAVLEAIG